MIKPNRLVYASILEDVGMNSHGSFDSYPAPTPSMLTSIYCVAINYISSLLEHSRQCCTSLQLTWQEVNQLELLCPYCAFYTKKTKCTVGMQQIYCDLMLCTSYSSLFQYFFFDLLYDLYSSWKFLIFSISVGGIINTQCVRETNILLKFFIMLHIITSHYAFIQAIMK